jgi:hypothetical protein
LLQYPGLDSRADHVPALYCKRGSMEDQQIMSNRLFYAGLGTGMRDIPAILTGTRMGLICFVSTVIVNTRFIFMILLSGSMFIFYILEAISQC